MEELIRIAKKNGGILKPEHVVESARDPASPLHRYFIWSDTEAARLWRLEQARRLIRAAVTVVHPLQPQPVRLFVSIPSDRHPDGGYRFIHDVMKNHDWRRQLLRQAMRDLIAFKRRYETLRELTRLMGVIDDTIERLESEMEPELV